MKNFLLRITAFFAATFFLHAADTNPPPRLTVELRDGSRVVGESVEQNFKFQSALLGEIKLAVNDIRSVECVTTNSAKLSTVKGDLLMVSFLNAEIPVQTSFGKVVLQVNTVRKLSVSAGGKGGHPSGLVAYWLADGDARDSIGNYDGSLVGGVYFAGGKCGQAFGFNGEDSYVRVENADALNLPNELTIEFWVKRKQLEEEDYIVNKGGDWTRGQLNYGVTIPGPNYDNALTFNFAGGTRHSTPITDLNWHHCAVIARDGQMDPEFFIDGVKQPVLSREGSQTVRLATSSKPLLIGAQADPTASYFSNVLLDELKIYNRALSADEIQEDYKAANPN